MEREAWKKRNPRGNLNPKIEGGGKLAPDFDCRFGIEAAARY